MMLPGSLCRCAVLTLLPLLGGCALSRRPLARDTGSFAAATISAAQGSTDAYLEANRLHAAEQTALAVLNYDSQPAWNPKDYAKPLLDPTQLAQRTAILQALQQYATLIADLGSSTRNTDLDAAGVSVADSLGVLSQTVGTRFATALPHTPTLSDSQVATLGGALGRLSEILRRRRLNRSLPAILLSADPQLNAICEVLVSDVEVLRSQADRDYTTLVEVQDRSIRSSQSQLTPADRRAAIARLPEMVRAQQQNDALLAELEEVLRNLARAHHALALAAQQKRGNSVAAAQNQQLSAAAQTLRLFSGAAITLPATPTAFPDLP